MPLDLGFCIGSDSEKVDHLQNASELAQQAKPISVNPSTAVLPRDGEGEDKEVAKVFSTSAAFPTNARIDSDADRRRIRLLRRAGFID